VKPAKATPKPAPEPVRERTREDGGAATPSARGGYLIQVGAFQDAANAARLAARLAQDKYPFQRVTLTRPSAEGGGHEVVVAGASADEINDKLQGTARKAVGTPDGVLIQPALPLKEAVTLSQELRADGLTVKIRRAQSAGALHVVRVGAYPNRSRAEAVRKELAEKGIPGFIVQGEGAR
jgi:cell division septation protein DedD